MSAAPVAAPVPPGAAPPPPPAPKRPRKPLAVLIVALVTLIGGLSILGVGIYDFVYATGGYYSLPYWAVGIIWVLLGVLLVALGYGLLRHRWWAWRWTLIVSVIVLIASIIPLVAGVAKTTAYAGLAISIILIIFLLVVRGLFPRPVVVKTS